MKLLEQIGISLLTTLFAVVFVLFIVPVEFNSLNLAQNGMLGATVTEISGTDTMSDFPTVYNANLNALNNGKIEVSTTTLTNVTLMPSLTTANALTSASSLATVGTITTGTWNADTLTVAYGGTGSTTLLSNGVLYGNGTSGILAVPLGTNGQVLSLSAGVPTWVSGTVDESLNYDWTGVHTWTTGTTTFNSEATFNDDVVFNASTTGAGFFNQTVYTSDDTFTVPTNVTRVKVRLVGGGGAGSNHGNNVGTGGGGGGGYCETFADVSATSSVNVIVGSASGVSSFSTFCSATGGVVGTFTDGGSGGVGSLGDINIKGGGGVGGSDGTAYAGAGGNSVLGGGGAGFFDAGSQNGNAGGNYGGGGSGCTETSDAGCSGGAGSGGIVIIEY